MVFSAPEANGRVIDRTTVYTNDHPLEGETIKNVINTNINHVEKGAVNNFGNRIVVDLPVEQNLVPDVDTGDSAFILKVEEDAL